MKNLFKIIIYFLLISNSFSQEIPIKDLKTPDTPGFKILDVSPSLINRPTNPKAFSTSLLSLTNSGTTIPKNFAFEISPYWFYKSKNNTVYKYLNIKDGNKSNTFSGVFNKMSISLASVYSDSTSGSLLKKTNYIAFGIRTNLITYRTEKQNESLKIALNIISERMRYLRYNKEEKSVLKKKLQNYSTKKDSLYQVLVNAKVEDRELAKSKYEEATGNYKEVELKIDQFENKAPNELAKNIEKDSISQENLKILEAKPLFQLDAAFAYSDAIPNNIYSQKKFNRSGFWMDAALSGFSLNNEDLQDNLSFIGCIRFIKDNVLDTNMTNAFIRKSVFDYGGKVEYTIKQFSISIEYLKREYSNESNLNSERTVGVMEYKINDDLFFTGTYGKNFGNTNNLFTLFGINYGFGKSQLKVNNN